jgi:hypothetical protein
MEHFTSKNYHSEFVMVSCPEYLRIDRIKGRDENNPDSLQLFQSRIDKEQSNLIQVMSEIIHVIKWAGSGNVSFSVIDTSIYGDMPKIHPDHIDRPGVESVVPNSLSVGTMFDLNSQFSDLTLRKLGISMRDLFNASHHVNGIEKMSDSVVWARRFTLRCVDELQELLKELPESWWSSDLADIRKARVELIDAWHFMMSASMALGMDAAAFTKAYYQKRAVNLTRQANGYLKRNKVKGDDTHVGLV